MQLNFSATSTSEGLVYSQVNATIGTGQNMTQGTVSFSSQVVCTSIQNVNSIGGMC